jgi:phosphatidylserine/phosphatidylglycerophosphate/cardiolipin synthase-like enzyme
MELLVQPGDHVAPLVRGIENADKSVHIAIFRFDSEEIERALRNAVKRGVAVHALVAYTNRSGDKKLRSLETQLLEYGVTVVRTGNGLTRYHDKLMIVDRQQLYLMAFNFTHRDIERSRSFGIVTSRRELVQEALDLYEADAKRQPFSIKSSNLIVSPLNARKRLGDFIRKAKKQLLIYDPKISDDTMIRTLEDRAKAGVEVKIIGRLTHNRQGLEVRKLSRLRLHTRTIICDCHSAFIGSQSLRKTELDARRELGAIFFDRRAVNRLAQIFEEDWASAVPGKTDAIPPKTVVQDTSQFVSKAVADDLPPVTPVVKEALDKIAGVKVNGSLDSGKVESAVKGAVTSAVEEAVEDVVKELIEETTSKGHD